MLLEVPFCVSVFISIFIFVFLFVIFHLVFLFLQIQVNKSTVELLLKQVIKNCL